MEKKTAVIVIAATVLAVAVVGALAWMMLPDIEEVEETLGVEFPEDEDYETFGGFVFATYGSLPDDGTTFELDAFGLHVNVLEIKDHRLISARVVVSTHNDGDEDVLS